MSNGAAVTVLSGFECEIEDRAETGPFIGPTVIAPFTLAVRLRQVQRASLKAFRRCANNGKSL